MSGFLAPILSLKTGEGEGGGATVKMHLQQAFPRADTNLEHPFSLDDSLVVGVKKLEGLLSLPSTPRETSAQLLLHSEPWLPRPRLPTIPASES